MKIKLFQIKALVYTIALLLCFSGCMHKEEVDIDLSAYQPKLVVHCVLCPDNKEIELKLTKTIPPDVLNAFDKQDLVVAGAEVIISNLQTGESIALYQSDQTSPLYTASSKEFEIIAGVAYQLSINAAGFTNVSSHTLVPLVSAEWLRTALTNKQFDFSVGQVFEGTYVLKDTLYDPLIAYASRDSRPGYETSYQDALVFENVVLSTNKRLVTIEILSQFVEVNLLTPSSELKRYLELEEFYAYNDLWGEVGSFESVYNGILPEYSNIENGFGVFGSYLEEKITYIPGPY